MCLFRYLVHILKVQYGLSSIYNIAIEILLLFLLLLLLSEEILQEEDKEEEI